MDVLQLYRNACFSFVHLAMLLFFTGVYWLMSIPLLYAVDESTTIIMLGYSGNESTKRRREAFIDKNIYSVDHL